MSNLEVCGKCGGDGWVASGSEAVKCDKCGGQGVIKK